MVLVMTSGNVSDEPIEYRDDTVFERLGRIADYFVTYNREIIGQGDDSVLYVVDEQPFFIRRSRGLHPGPLPLRRNAPAHPRRGRRSEEQLRRGARGASSS